LHLRRTHRRWAALAVALTAATSPAADPPGEPPALLPWKPAPAEASAWTPAVPPPPAPVVPPSVPAPLPVKVAAVPPVPLIRPTKPVPPAKTAPLPLPLPRSVPAAPANPAPAPVTPPVPAAAVWGGGQMPAGAAAGCDPAPVPVPVKHGVYGSPNLTISRDYRFLDLFGAGLWGDDAVVVGPAADDGRPSADRSFLEVDYLLGWVNAGRVPVLATAAGPNSSSMGFLGQPGTRALLGPGGFGGSSRSGFRARAGTWLDGGPGVDGSVFFYGTQTTRAAFDSARYPTLARPFFAPNSGQEFAEVVARPGLAAGRLEVEQTSFLWGADVNARCCLENCCDARSELFAGYRHVNLTERLTLTEFITSGPAAAEPEGTRIVVRDSFKTQNQFHGGQVGYAFGRRSGRFEWDGRASLALGVTHQEVGITGTQAVARPDAEPQLFRGGLLAAGPNLGTFDRTRFSVVPELALGVGYRVTPGVKLSVGYNFLYWSNVLRPGDQIDRVVDLSFVPNGPPATRTTNRPLPTFKSSDLSVHAIQFGVEARW